MRRVVMLLFSIFIWSTFTCNSMAADAISPIDVEQFKADGTNYKARVELKCGSHVVAIDCGKSLSDEQQNRICASNTLSFTDVGKSVFIVDSKKDFYGQIETKRSPTCISCRVGIDNKYYVFVEYSSMTHREYIAYEIFEESGDRITVNEKSFSKIARNYSVNFRPYICIEDIDK